MGANATVKWCGIAIHLCGIYHSFCSNRQRVGFCVVIQIISGTKRKQEYRHVSQNFISQLYTASNPILLK